MVFLKALTATGEVLITSTEIAGITAGATTVVVTYGVTPSTATWTVADAAAAVKLAEGAASLLAKEGQNTNPGSAAFVSPTTLVAVIA